MVNVLRAEGVPLMVTSARRDADTQARLVREGRSLTLNSAHLDGRAFDVDVHGFHRDAVPLAFWHLLGPWAEKALGLTWGGRWTSLRDYGHFELRRTSA